LSSRPKVIFLYSALKVRGQIRKAEKARNFAIEMAIPKLGLRFACLGMAEP
jgi:hypothetical protein